MREIIADIINSFRVMFSTRAFIDEENLITERYTRSVQTRRQRTNLKRSVFVAFFLLGIVAITSIWVSCSHLITKVKVIAAVSSAIGLLIFIFVASKNYNLSDEAYEEKKNRTKISVIYCLFWALYGVGISFVPQIFQRGARDRILCIVLLFIVLTVPIFSRKEAISLVPVGVLASLNYLSSDSIDLNVTDIFVFIVVVLYLVAGSQINQLERIESYYQIARNKAEYYETKRRLGKIFEEVFDFAFEFDSVENKCTVLRGNKNFDAFLTPNITFDEFIDDSIDIVHPDDTAICEKNFNLEYLKNEFLSGRTQVYFEVRLRDKEGKYTWSSVMITKETDSITDKFFLCLVQDIEERKRNENKLKLEAENDPLTQIYNKVTTKSLIEECIENNPSSQHALMIMDIDNFKTINDTKGHAVGDQILLAFAAELNKNFRETDIVGRAGGDEFIVLMKNVQSVALVCDKLQRLTASFKKYGITHGFPGRLSTSIGVALYNKDGKTYEELFKRADAALYEAKRNGKDQYKFSMTSFD